MNWSQLSLTWQFMYLTWFFWKLWVSHTSIISKAIVCSLNESSTHCLSFLAISAGTSHLVWQGDGDHRNSTINLKGERQILRVQYLTVVLLNCSGFSVATASPIFLKVFPWFLTKNDDLISLYLCGKRESEGEEEKETAGKKSCTCCVYCFHVSGISQIYRHWSWSERLERCRYACRQIVFRCIHAENQAHVVEKIWEKPNLQILSESAVWLPSPLCMGIKNERETHCHIHNVCLSSTKCVCTTTSWEPYKWTCRLVDFVS